MRLPLTITIALLVAQVTQPPQPVASPAPRGGHGMTYDDERGVSLMFGGSNRQGRLNDLWGWDGLRWQLLSASGPSARDSAVLVFDSRRKKAILHGGRAADGLRDDTWEWMNPLDRAAGDGARSAPASCGCLRSTTRPPGGLRRVAADGQDGAAAHGRTWGYDGETWTRRDTAGVPIFVSSMTTTRAAGRSAPGSGRDGRAGRRPPHAEWAWDGRDGRACRQALASRR